MSQLPIQLQQQIAEAEQIQRHIASEEEMTPRRGHPKSEKPLGKVSVLVADSLEELDMLCAAMIDTVGAATRGNKRRGKAASLHADLLQYFIGLRDRGITLPRGGNLSHEACQYGLFDILQRHGYTSSDETETALDSRARRKEIANTLRSQFDWVASVVNAIDVDKSRKE